MQYVKSEYNVKITRCVFHTHLIIKNGDKVVYSNYWLPVLTNRILAETNAVRIADQWIAEHT